MTPSGKMDRPSDLRMRGEPEATSAVLQLPTAPRRVDVRRELESQRTLMEIRAWSLFALALVGVVVVAIFVWLV